MSFNGYVQLFRSSVLTDRNGLTTMPNVISVISLIRMQCCFSTWWQSVK